MRRRRRRRQWRQRDPGGGCGSRAVLTVRECDLRYASLHLLLLSDSLGKVYKQQFLKIAELEQAGGTPLVTGLTACWHGQVELQVGPNGMAGHLSRHCP